MNRKERLKQIMKEEAETISKAADQMDYEVMSRILDLLCSVKKHGKKVILAGCGTAGSQENRPYLVGCGDSGFFPFTGRFYSWRNGCYAEGGHSCSSQ